MRESKAKGLRAIMIGECERRGIDNYKLAFRRLKRIYNRTPRLDRAKFSIYEK